MVLVTVLVTVEVPTAVVMMVVGALFTIMVAPLLLIMVFCWIKVLMYTG